jgi:hypothetical protein
MKTRLSWLLALALLPFAAHAQTVDEILSKVYAARGGLDKIHAVKAERVSGHLSFPGQEGQETITGPFVVELKRPLKMHMQVTIQDLTMVRVYNGKGGGWANNPFAGKVNPEAMSAEDIETITDESDFDGPLVDYKLKGNQIELVGKEKVGDKDVWRLKLTPKIGEVRYYLFDANSFLLLKWEGKRMIDGQKVPTESVFSDYREVDGLKYAFEIDTGASAAEISQKLTIEKIELNPQIDEADFAKPPTPAGGAPSGSND